MYSEDDYLMLSGIQHFVFCRRQWALIHIENQWAENYRTIDGNIMHEKAHDDKFTEKRKNVIVTRGMPVYSKKLGVSGICDIVELIRDDDNGININGRRHRYKIVPVEYKRGEEKQGEEDILQLVTQAMCLEEMLLCKIDYGYIFYGKTKRRVKVDITLELREKVIKMFSEMHNYYKRKYTPKVRRTKSCNACSLKDICIPSLYKKKSVKDYIKEHLKD